MQVLIFLKSMFPALINYWKPILCVIALAWVYMLAVKHTNAERDAQEAQHKAAMQIQKDALQTRNDNLNSELATYRARRAAEKYQARKDAANEISHNEALSKCVASPEFIRLYRQAATGALRP